MNGRGSDDLANTDRYRYLGLFQPATTIKDMKKNHMLCGEDRKSAGEDGREMTKVP